MREKTRLVHGCSGVDKSTGCINFPVYHGTTFAHPALGETTMGFAYARVDSPTRQELERTIALLEKGAKAWAFSSGMAAITAWIKLLNPGDHIIVSEDLYGGTYRIFTEIYAKYGYEFSFVDTSDTKLVRACIRENTKAIYIETPSNPMMHVSNIKVLSDIIHDNGGILAVDNTFLSPYFQKPILFGADYVIHSGTKYIGGHNDVLSGFLIAAHERDVEKINLLVMSEGALLGPDDSWLLLRSLKTLSVRMEQQEKNALILTDYLKQQKDVERVYYVGDTEHPQYALSKKQTTGFGGMISFSMKSGEKIPELLTRFQVITFAESLGGVESLITFPMIQTHGAIPAEMRERLGVNDRLLRLSVGIEDVDDLIDDFEYAFSIL